MRQFFVPPELLRQPSATITGDLFRHLATVLRFKAGDPLILADGCGHEVVARVSSIDKGSLTVVIEAEKPAAGPCRQGLALTLCQGLPKGDKMELVIQKGTELGMTRIAVFNAERSIARLDGERLRGRLARWEKIAGEAARQSGRPDIPAVIFYRNLQDLLAGETGELKLLLWEGEKQQGLKDLAATVAAPASVTMMIGPEGGLSADEARLAADSGYVPLSLGRRILRTETAGLAAAAVVQYLWGDLG